MIIAAIASAVSRPFSIFEVTADDMRVRIVTSGVGTVQVFLLVYRPNPFGHETYLFRVGDVVHDGEGRGRLMRRQLKGERP